MSTKGLQECVWCGKEAVRRFGSNQPYGYCSDDHTEIINKLQDKVENSLPYAVYMDDSPPVIVITGLSKNSH